MLLRTYPSKGHSLIEMLVALALSGILLAATVQGSVTLLKCYQKMVRLKQYLVIVTKIRFFLQQDLRNLTAQGWQILDRSQWRQEKTLASQTFLQHVPAESSILLLQTIEGPVAYYLYCGPHQKCMGLYRHALRQKTGARLCSAIHHWSVTRSRKLKVIFQFAEYRCQQSFPYQTHQ